MRFHDLGDHFVLVGELGRQRGDFLLEFPLPPIGAALKGRCTVFKGLFLPAVKYRRVQSILVTQIRDWDLVNQVPPQDRYLLLPRKRPSLLRHSQNLLCGLWPF